MVVVAGGSSRRMGFDKLTADLEGQPVLARSLAAFEHCQAVKGLVLVCSASGRSTLETIARQAAPGKLHAVVAGGAHRHLSVGQGLEAVPDGVDFIAVHDAARPLVTTELVLRVLEGAALYGAAACARPVTDTLKRVNGEDFITEGVDRDHLWCIETPQIFRAGLLLEAYRHLRRTGGFATDETSAVQSLGAPVHLVEAKGWNFKITYPDDLELVRLILRQRLAAAAG